MLSIISGLGAIVLWSLAAVLIVALDKIPLFQLVGSMYFLGFLFGACRLSYAKNWSSIKQQYRFYLIGIVLCAIYQWCILYAFKVIPPAHAELINYLWPLSMIVFSPLLPNERFKWIYLIFALTATGALFSFLIFDRGLTSLNFRVLGGYVSGVIGAVAWGGFMLFSRYQTTKSSLMPSMYCGGAALISFVFHFFFETTYIPNGLETISLLSLGIGVCGISFSLWDYGIKNGDFRLLGIAAYFTPILSILFLIIWGKAEMTWSLMGAASIVLISCLLVWRVGELSKGELES